MLLSRTDRLTGIDGRPQNGVKNGTGSGLTYGHLISSSHRGPRARTHHPGAVCNMMPRGNGSRDMVLDELDRVRFSGFPGEVFMRFDVWKPLAWRSLSQGLY